MKSIFISILLTIFIQQSFAQPINQKAKDRNGNDMLIGCCTIEALMQEPYASWFLKNYTDYQIDTLLTAEIKKNMANKEFILFLGTWCGDSKREVPRILKLLHYCGATTEQIKLVMVSNHANEYKQSPSHEERGMNILRVPTLIVLQNNKEMNRIVESPVESIEKDLLKILTGKTYLHNYADIQSSAFHIKY